MNAQAAYLAWLRINAPEVYTGALRKVAGKARGLGGLADDLLARMSRTSTGFGFFGDDTTDLPTITVTADAIPTVDNSSLALTPDDLATLNDTLSQQDLQSSVSLTALPTVPMAAPTVTTGSNLFASIIQAVGTVTAAGMQASTQSSLVKLNTQRAAAGLPPVNANGVPINTGFLPPSSNPTIARLEAGIAGAGSSPMLWIAALAVGALFLLRKKA